MASRVLALLRAGFQSQWGSGAWPVAPLVMHGSLAWVLCALFGDVLPPYGYAIFALSLSAGLLLLVLLGEFGSLLAADEAGEWIEAQPVRAVELRIARALLVFTLLGALAFAALLPAALYLPGAGVGTKLLFLVVGFAQALFLAACLLVVQALLGRRAEGVLVSLQTLLVGGIVLGVVLGPRLAQELSHLATHGAQPEWFVLLPSTWFAAPFDGQRGELGLGHQLAPWIATVAALFALAAIPSAKQSNGRTGRGPLDVLVAPLRALATRVWVRRDERGAFDLVCDALPKEREFILRTYPMFGIPLAFLIAGARGSHGETREGLLALLLFTPATYLPVLLLHVPASRSADARWILDSAPVSRIAIAGGAVKALALRFLLPLYAVLFALAWSQTSFDFALRMTLPGVMLSLLVLRPLYRFLVHDLPLSVLPERIEGKIDWTGQLLGLALGLTVLAVLAAHYLTSIPLALGVTAALVFAYLVQERMALRDLDGVRP